MSYSNKYRDKRCRRHYEHTDMESSGLTNEYDTDSVYTYESTKHGYRNYNIQHKSKHYGKESRLHGSNNEIGPLRAHNAKCPVYVHNMKMQKHYSQNDAYEKPRNQPSHQAEVYSSNKWDYYDDRTHYMKNKFDKLTLSNDYDEKHQKSECTRKPCPVHHCCNTVNKPNKKHTRPEPIAVDEEVINKLEESYWEKWRPTCKGHDRKIGAGEVKMIRTEEDCRRKVCCESERNLPIRCPDCFKCIPDDKDVKCLHKRAATKESKSSDFVKSEFDDGKSPIEDNYTNAKTDSNTKGCECPKNYPGNEETISSGQNSQAVVEESRHIKRADERQLSSKLNKKEFELKGAESQKQDCEVPTCPYVIANKLRKTAKTEVDVKGHSDKSTIEVKAAKSQTQDCQVPTCPYVIANKLRKTAKNEVDAKGHSDKSTIEVKAAKSQTQDCQVPTCPYVIANKLRITAKNEVDVKEHSDKSTIEVKAAKSQTQACQLSTCPYVVAEKIRSKNSEPQTSSTCNNPRCPYTRFAKYRTAVSLEGQDVEEQLKITQYSNKIMPKSAVNKGVNAEEPISAKVIVPPKKGDTIDKTIIDADAKTKISVTNHPMITGDSKAPSTVKPTVDESIQPGSPSILIGPEGAENPVILHHKDSFILTSIKQNSQEGQMHYKQPTTIKLSNVTRVKGHSYPLKPILKKTKPQTPRKTLHSPKKPVVTNAKSLKPTQKKR